MKPISKNASSHRYILKCINGLYKQRFISLSDEVLYKYYIFT